MANKPLKTIRFPGLSDTYTIPQVDDSLSITGAAADAKKVGDEISDLKADISELEPFSDEAKTALLNCFKNVGWKDGDGSQYVDALTRALYGEKYIVAISVVFNAQGNTVHVLDGINSLKQYLTVTGRYNNGETKVLSATEYVLSGKLAEGANTITAAVGLIQDTFTVNAEASVVATLTGADLLEGGFSGQPTSYGIHYNRPISGYPRATYTYFGFPLLDGYKYRFLYSTTVSGTVTTQVRYLTQAAAIKAQNLEQIDLNTELLHFETGWKQSGFEFTGNSDSAYVWFTLQRGTNEALTPSDVTSVSLECIESAA